MTAMAAMPTPQPTSSKKPADPRDTLKVRTDEVGLEPAKPAVETLDADAYDPYDNVACTD
ncbi:MAG TPA: hypothetical protein VH044_02685 [Polyangiaceae bacterium]|jgi:hypothetical protein|nr:hypothetical protein [Polyangiaceae bacterium]